MNLLQRNATKNRNTCTTSTLRPPQNGLVPAQNFQALVGAVRYFALHSELNDNKLVQWAHAQIQVLPLIIVKPGKGNDGFISSNK